MRYVHQAVDNLDGLLTIAEVTNRYRVSRVTVWRWISEGRLPAYRLGQRKVRIKASDLEAVLAPITPGEGGPVNRMAAIREVERVQAEIARRRGGRPLNDAAEVLARSRSERDDE
jgi:excisionase family DNA binding protein